MKKAVIKLTAEEMASYLALPTPKKALEEITAYLVHEVGIPLDRARRIAREAYYDTLYDIGRELWETLGIYIRGYDEKGNFYLMPLSGLNWESVIEELAYATGFRERFLEEAKFALKDEGKKPTTANIIKWGLDTLHHLFVAGKVNFVAAFPPLYAVGADWEEVYTRVLDANLRRAIGILL